MPGTVELSALNATNGFRVNGISAGDYSGQSVSGAGDVNGDGFADILIGARGADPHGSASGQSYVVYGGGAGLVGAAVSATKVVSPGPYSVGSTVTYTAVLTNTGGTQGDNPGHELTDVLPSGLALVSASATTGRAVANVGTNTVTWDGAIPGGGGTVTITITATILPAAAGQTVANQGTVLYDGDRQPNNGNEASAKTDDPAAGGRADATQFQVGETAIPALAPAGRGAMLIALGGLGVGVLRRKRRSGE